MDKDSTPRKPPGTAQVQAAARALRARFSLRRGIAALAADLLLGAATLLLLFGIFMAWQAWLVQRTAGATQDLARARQDVAQKMGLVIAERRAAVIQALTRPALVGALAAGDDGATREALAQRIKAEVPDADAVTLYSPQLNEVLRGNLQALGYARAAQLMTAMSGDDVGAAQSPQKRVFSIAAPVTGSDGSVLAYATVDFRDAPLRIALHSARIRAGRLDLRQTNKSGDTVLDTIGDTNVATTDDASVAVANSL